MYSICYTLAGTLENKESFGHWTTENIKWNMVAKNRANMVLVSGEKIPEKKDSKVTSDTDINTTSNAKELGLLEKGKAAFEKGVKIVKNVWHSLGEEKFWLFWDDGKGSEVLPGGEEQVWKKTDQTGGYFTLENTDSRMVLTAVNGKFQVEGT